MVCVVLLGFVVLLRVGGLLWCIVVRVRCVLRCVWFVFWVVLLGLEVMEFWGGVNGAGALELLVS